MSPFRIMDGRLQSETWLVHPAREREERGSLLNATDPAPSTRERERESLPPSLSYSLCRGTDALTVAILHTPASLAPPEQQVGKDKTVANSTDRRSATPPHCFGDLNLATAESAVAHPLPAVARGLSLNASKLPQQSAGVGRQLPPSRNAPIPGAKLPPSLIVTVLLAFLGLRAFNFVPV